MTGDQWVEAAPVIAVLVGFVVSVLVFGTLARVVQR